MVGGREGHVESRGSQWGRGWGEKRKNAETLLPPWHLFYSLIWVSGELLNRRKQSGHSTELSEGSRLEGHQAAEKVC